MPNTAATQRSKSRRGESLEELARQGRETAFRLLAAFERERLVASFVEDYVRQHNRRKLKASPVRHSELLTMLTRESLVAAAARMNAELTRRLASPARGKQGANQATAIDAFEQAFVEAIAAALRWTPGDVAEFARDVALYGRMTGFTEPPPEPAARAGRRISAGSSSPFNTGGPALTFRSMRNTPPRSPFPDRCAMLLDPSLMEKARAAALVFYAALDGLASKTIAETFRKRA
ncbi:MAG: hypothetical protein ACRD5G_07190 [Candidatus Acidiferrales bacterium]